MNEAPDQHVALGVRSHSSPLSLTKTACRGTHAVRYGPQAAQTAELYLPRGQGPHPVVALLHGGLWRVSQRRESMRPLARDLARHGFAALNLEYRRVGEPGAGWPGTFLDAADGVALAARVPGLDTRRLAVVGHCSGGHLALWAAAWLGGPRPDTEGAARVAVRSVVTLAAVTDLRAAERDSLDLSVPLAPAGAPPAAVALLGGSSVAVAGRYRLGSPLDLLPLGRQTAQLLVHGDADEVVPLDYALRYAREAERAGDRVRLARYPGMGHFDMLDPAHVAWREVIRHLRAELFR
jgi:acetyl esterase/lipase